MKEKLWRVGNILKVMTNHAWSEPNYYRMEHIILRASFMKCKYLNSELIHEVIDFTDISAKDRETRDDAKTTYEQPLLAMPWKDNDDIEYSQILPNPWCVAIGFFVFYLIYVCF
jgi:hypothetical protein